MRLPSNLGAALNVGYNDAMGFTEDPRIQQNIDRSQSLSQDALAMLGKLEGLRAPEPVRPAYRTEDLLGLLLGGVLSGGGREIPNLLAGFQQGKLGRAQQDTETNNQRFNQQADSIQRQGTILGQQAGIARQTADDLLGAQGRKQAVAERRRSAVETAEIRRSELEERKRKTTFDGLVGQVKAIMSKAKSGPKERVEAARAVEDLVKRNPEYADQLLTYRDPSVLNELTPGELLTVAKVETENALRQYKINDYKSKIESRLSGMKVNDARVAKFAEETRLLPEKIAIQNEMLRIRAVTGQAYADNVRSMIEFRGPTFDLKKAAQLSLGMKDQLGNNSFALGKVAEQLNNSQKRVDAMKAQHGDKSPEYLDAVEEFNALSVSEAQLKEAREALVREAEALRDKIIEVESPDYMPPLGLPGVAGAENALPGNVNFGRLGVQPVAPSANVAVPKTGASKPKASQKPKSIGINVPKGWTVK